MNPYPWLHVGEDGSIRADLQGCTGAEMDRRLVIMQEIEAGRLVVAGKITHERDRAEKALEDLLATTDLRKAPDRIKGEVGAIVRARNVRLRAEMPTRG